MRIERIKLVNFRSHAETELELGDVTFVLGANGAGKSSVADALEWLLTGRNQHTDAAGRNRNGLARTGHSGFAVEATVEGAQLARRSSGASVLLSKDGHPVQEFALPASRDVLSAVLNAGRFLGLAEKEQKALLAQVLDSGSVDVPQEVQADMALLNPLDRRPRISNVAECEGAYKHFYDERRIFSRQLAELGEIAAPEVPEGAVGPEKVQAHLAQRRRERDALVEQRARRTAAFDAGQKLRRELEEKKARLEADVLLQADEQRAIDATTHAADIKEWSEKRAQLDKEIAGLEAMTNNLLAMRGKCPTCIRKISAGEQQELAAKLKEELADLQGKREKLEQKVAKYDDPATAAGKLQRHREAAAALVKLEKELAKLPSDAAEAVDTSDLDSQLADLDARIAKGEAALAESQQQLRAVKAYREAEERKAKLEARHAACERLVAYFGPNGVRAQLAEGKLEPFNLAVNGGLEKFGFGCAITLEPYKLIVTTPGGQTLEAAQLSESERFRFGVALQVALAQATGVGLVVVDRADVLDRETRRGLNAMLLEAARAGVQSLVLATSTEGAPASAPEGVQFHQLVNQDGETRVVGQAAEVAA